MVSGSKQSPGGQECSSRLSVQTEPNPAIRMVSLPIHHPENPDDLGLSNGECDSRLPVQTEPNPSIRMVSSPIHRPENPADLGLSNGGSLCHQE